MTNVDEPECDEASRKDKINGLPVEIEKKEVGARERRGG